MGRQMYYVAVDTTKYHGAGKYKIYIGNQFRASRDKATGGVKEGRGRGSLGATRKEKDDALRTLVKSGKGVTVVGKDAKRFGKNAKGGDAPTDDGSAKWKL